VWTKISWNCCWFKFSALRGKKFDELEVDSSVDGTLAALASSPQRNLSSQYTVIQSALGFAEPGVEIKVFAFCPLLKSPCSSN
jgi:hypothetical protein